MENCRLPVEILEVIIQHIPEPDNSVALPASDIVTKSLYSCLFVSKATFASSLEQLYRRCLYIDSTRRLEALLRSYSSTIPIFGRTVEPAQFRCAASTSLYLAPFSSDTIDERRVVDGIQRLFTSLAEHLRRLVIDMPLRSYYPDEAGSANLRSVLRSAFLRLKAVEEFVNVRDELYLSTMVPSDYSTEPPVWSTWKRLQRLALYNLCADEEMVDFLNTMPELKELVLTRPDLQDGVRALRNPDLVVTLVNTWRDFRPEYRRSMNKSWMDNPAQPFGSVATWHRTARASARDEVSGRYCELPNLDIIIVDGQDPVTDPRSSHHHGGPQFRGNNWAAYDLRHTFNDIRVCQEWVKRNALSGWLLPELTQSWPPRPFAVKAPSK